MPQAEGKVTRLSDLLNRIPALRTPSSNAFVRSRGVDKGGPGCNSRKVYEHGFSFEACECPSGALLRWTISRSWYLLLQIDIQTSAALQLNDTMIV